MTWRSLVLLAALVAVSPYLYDVYRVLRILLFNTPDRLPAVANFTTHGTLYKDHMRNCEDVVMDTSNGIAIVSCSPGRDKWNTVMGTYIDSMEHGYLYLYRYGSEPTQPPSLIPLEGFDAPFHPIGLTYHAESQTLAVTNHGGEQASIEIFTLDPDSKAPRASFLQSISDSVNLPTPNSLVFLNATHLYASNTHQIGTFTTPTTIFQHMRVRMAALEHRLGIPTGSVSLVDLTNNVATKVLHLGFANGVDLLDNGCTLAVASTSKAAVYLYRVDSDPVRPSYLRRITLPFLPDNLSVDSRGRLLVAGHPHAASLYKMARSNWECHTSPDKQSGCFRAPSWVMEWDPSAGPEGVLRSLFVGDTFASSSSVVYDAGRNFLVISGLYELGLLVARQ